MKFIQAKNYTMTSGRKIDLAVIHDMEYPEKGTAAEDVAMYFHNQARSNTAGSSAHYCVDSNSIVQCVREKDVAWHAPGANHNGLGFEHAGYARQNAHEWADEYSRQMLKVSAQLVAQKCKQFAIPPVFLHAPQLAAGMRGITTHWQVTIAFSGGRGHTDPGPNFPIETYVNLVKHNLGLGVGVPPPPEMPPIKAPEPRLRKGDRGWRVAQAQRLLSYAGFPTAKDGVFGDNTEHLVKIFQSAHSLQMDGVIGPNTWRALWQARYL
jgi:N-acetyl-anhydromuramyl-L-alanine amidase AmpD